MKVLDHKLLRELIASKGLILAITSLMAVGVMAFIYMRSAYANLNRAKDDYYRLCRMADFWIDVKKAPLSELEELASLPGVSEVRPRIQFYATVDLERVEEPLNGLVLSLPDKRGPIINDVMLKRGGYFTGRRRNEVIVNDSFATQHGLYPGQWVHLLLNNRREELFIVGTAISSEFVYLVGPGSLAPDPEHFGVFYLPQSYAEEVFDFDGAANQVVGLLAPEIRDRPDEVLREAERRLASYGVFSTTARKDQPSNRFLSDEIQGLGTFAGIMPTIFLAVAALVLNVLMVRLIDQQRAVIGTLKGLGYSSAQIFLHFTKFGGLIGLVSGLLGCLLGYEMASFVTKLYRQFFEFPNLANFFYVGLSIAGLTISLVCALTGSMQGARAALRLQPAEAMRPRPPTAGGRIWLERFTALWRRLGFGWRMVLRNFVRHRLRTTVGVFAVAMGASLMTAGFMLREGVKYIIDFQFEQVMRSDVDLTFKDERGIDAAHEIRKRHPGTGGVRDDESNDLHAAGRPAAARSAVVLARDGDRPDRRGPRGPPASGRRSRRTRAGCRLRILPRPLSSQRGDQRARRRCPAHNAAGLRGPNGARAADRNRHVAQVGAIAERSHRRRHRNGTDQGPSPPHDRSRGRDRR